MTSCIIVTWPPLYYSPDHLQPYTSGPRRTLLVYGTDVITYLIATFGPTGPNLPRVPRAPAKP